MPTISLQLLLLWPLSVVIAALLSVMVCVAVINTRTKRQQRQVTLLNTVIRDYFRHSGVEVSVDSLQRGPGNRFTAFVESEPMKRFRLSHIIEMTLRAHIAKTCGLELDKIYWRFPIREAATAATGTGADKPADKSGDDYINEGLVNYRDLPKVDVSEIPWERFEEFANSDPNAPAVAAASPSQSR
ncbi:hypothetical protein [Janthinobacterium sp. 17J80-10]|uniref:hypothetical protein n=1 Tax=Janthinobacterium sp. 17J80-10 TaxID=2497863 RepID=UPI00100577A6|nr:hypothetical protein [Janthinobacterium sp. 17J80-10]QAU35177.1 hypothetical protein EKL02_13880 [Janthinobacterium sp. 17J80-10]